VFFSISLDDLVFVLFDLFVFGLVFSVSPKVIGSEERFRNDLYRVVLDLYAMLCIQECGTSAEKWVSSICSSLEGASHHAPRGKHARHADIVQLVHITSPLSLDSVLTSARELVVTTAGQMRCS